MSDEVTRTGSENPSHECLSAPWRASAGSWHCAECGRWICTITGRVSIRRPDLYKSDENLKSIARAYVKKHGSDQWEDLGHIKTEDFVASYTEADQSFLAQWYRKYYPDFLSDDDERDSEVS